MTRQARPFFRRSTGGTRRRGWALALAWALLGGAGCRPEGDGAPEDSDPTDETEVPDYAFRALPTGARAFEDVVLDGQTAWIRAHRGFYRLEAGQLVPQRVDGPGALGVDHDLYGGPDGAPWLPFSGLRFDGEGWQTTDLAFDPAEVMLESEPGDGIVALVDANFSAEGECPEGESCEPQPYLLWTWTAEGATSREVPASDPVQVAAWSGDRWVRASKDGLVDQDGLHESLGAVVTDVLLRGEEVVAGLSDGTVWAGPLIEMAQVRPPGEEVVDVDAGHGVLRAVTADGALWAEVDGAWQKVPVGASADPADRLTRVRGGEGFVVGLGGDCVYTGDAAGLAPTFCQEGWGPGAVERVSGLFFTGGSGLVRWDPDGTHEAWPRDRAARAIAASGDGRLHLIEDAGVVEVGPDGVDGETRVERPAGDSFVALDRSSGGWAVSWLLGWGLFDGADWTELPDLPGGVVAEQVAMGDEGTLWATSRAEEGPTSLARHDGVAWTVVWSGPDAGDLAAFGLQAALVVQGEVQIVAPDGTVTEGPPWDGPLVVDPATDDLWLGPQRWRDGAPSTPNLGLPAPPTRFMSDGTPVFLSEAGDLWWGER